MSVVRLGTEVVLWAATWWMKAAILRAIRVLRIAVQRPPPHRPSLAADDNG